MDFKSVTEPGRIFERVSFQSAARASSTSFARPSPPTDVGVDPGVGCRQKLGIFGIAPPCPHYEHGLVPLYVGWSVTRGFQNGVVVGSGSRPVQPALLVLSLMNHSRNLNASSWFSE